MRKALKSIGKYIRDNHLFWVCTLITLGLLALGFFRFPNAIGRLVESCWDFCTAFVDVLCDTFGISNTLLYTGNEMPDYTFLNIKEWVLGLFEQPSTPTVPVPPVEPTPPATPSVPSAPSIPSAPIPTDWEQFKINWNLYWQAFASKKNLLLYGYYTLYYLANFLRIALWAFLFALLVCWFFKKYYFTGERKSETDEEKQNVMRPIKESKTLRWWHRFYFNTLFRIGTWFMNLYYFIKEHKDFWQFWLLLALLYFNVLTIAIEFLAYIVYFTNYLSFGTLYTQVYKLCLDLKPVVTFVPIVGWVALLLVGLDKWAKNIGYERLKHNERKNRGFINELGIVTYIYAEMGEGKTTMLTSVALSNEVQLRDDALEVILECDSCFPDFPWVTLERVLKKAYAEHVVYDKWSCIRFIRGLRDAFLKEPCKENVFGYKIDRYPITFDNKKYVEDIWETIQDYALAYTIYTTQSALIVSNYSIRVDSLMVDLGHFPVWNCDFFKRDSRLIDSFSRHSKILDYDMVRLGNQMIKNNPNRYAFGWGVWVYTELDKEAKNTQEQQEMKFNDEECNQKNDLMHVLFKMSRHACMIRHRNFVRILADMQRVENITANLRQIGQVALISDKDDKKVVLPWFSAYKLFSPPLLSLKSRIDNIYVNNRVARSDKRLLTNALEKTRATLGNWDVRTVGVYGSRVLHIELQAGRMDGKVRERKYYIQDKKDYAKRNGSDCMAGTFESRGELNTIGLDDMAEYADYIATQDELLSQNSYTQKELKKYEGGALMERKVDIKVVDKLLSSTVEGLMAMQNGKITVSEETKSAAQVLIKELCATVVDWSEEKENAEQSA